MAGVLEGLAALSRYIPSVEKPARRPPLPTRLAWTALVVVPPPRLDLAPRVGQRQEPVRVQALVAQAAVEALDVGVLVGLARLDQA